MSRPFSIQIRLLINISHIRAADTLPPTVVKENDSVAIDAIYLVAVTIHRVPIRALFDQETAVPINIGGFVGITVHLTAGTVVYIPIAGTALHSDVSPWIIVDILAIDAVNQVSVFIGEIPCVATPDTIIAVVQQVDLVAVEN